MKVFFDTNILLYTLALEDPLRQEISLQLLSDGGVISAQVLNEFAAVAHRKLKMDWTEVRSALSELRLLLPTPSPITVATHAIAIALADQHKFSFYDALIIASALEASCTTLYTEDLHHGMIVRQSLQIINPFIGVADDSS